MNTLINERYEVNLGEKENLLGRGGEGHVYIGRDKILKSDIAVKIVDVTEFFFSPYNVQNSIQKLQSEFQKVELFDHVNIIGYYDWGIFSRKRRIYFATIMDLADSGSLATWTFDNENKKLSHVNDFFIGVLEGLKYIHDKGIVHRDLKPSNILIKKAESGKLTPLLTDLLTNIGSQANNELVVTARFQKTFGTIEYMAPELLGTKNIFVGTMTDLWSFGVIVYEFFKGELPFGTREKGDSPIEIAKQILSKEVDISGIPSPYNKVIELCLEKDITSRISKVDILLEVIKRHQQESEESIIDKDIVEKEYSGFKILPKSKTKKLGKQRTIILQSFIMLQSMAVHGVTMIGDSNGLPPIKELPNGLLIEDNSKYERLNAEEKNEGFKQQEFKKSLLDEIQLLKEEIAALKESSKDKKENISIEQLKNLISDDKLSDCFQVLNLRRNLFSHDTDKTFITIKGEWSQLKKQELLGFLDFETVSRSTNKLRYKLLTFIDIIELEEN